MSYRYRYHVIPVSKRRQPFESERYVANDIDRSDSAANSTSVILHHIEIDIYIYKRQTKMPLCCFDIGNNGISLLKRRQQFDGGQISASKSEKPT